MLQKVFMIKKLLVLLLLFNVVGYSLSAQPKTIRVANGKWTLIQYPSGIIKVIFQPLNYSTTENISDAVIAKPVSTSINSFKANGDTIQIASVKIIAMPYTNGYRGFQFLLTNGEKIYGGGERALPFDRRGYKLNLYNAPAYGYGEGAENLNYSVPFFTSSNGYGLLFDNPSKGYVDIGKSNKDILEYGTFSGELNVYVIPGKDYKNILAAYYKLTGTQPMPPRWALGNFMSRFGYTSEAQAKDIAAKMKAEHIPFDALIFDLFWFGDSIQQTLGNLDWINKNKWPNPKQMIADFRKQNINTILVTEPYVVKRSINYDQSKKYLATDSTGKAYDIKEFYFGNGGLIDLFKKDARNWFWSYYKKQMNNGVEAWWGDLGEPETHPSALYHNLSDFGFNRLFKADEVHNIYGHNWTKMLFEKYAVEYPNKRLFSLNRSGFSGTQRYSIFPWSGDVSRSWSGFRAQLPVMLGMSMSGIPYAHADAGGFAGGEGDNELYVRWLQFAQYTPILRPHGTALYEIDKNAFSFPSEPALIAEPYKTAARKIVTNRYKMLPYNYTLSYRQAKYGEPLVYPLYYQYSNDIEAAKTENEFMWGEAVLVAPVLEKNATERKVYLPAGDWYYLNSNTRFTGADTLNIKVQLEDIPVFAKAGSIIPYANSAELTTTKSFGNDSSLTWHYYSATTPSEYILYEDDGESKNALSTAQYELITIKVIPDTKGYMFLIHSNNGNYKGRPVVRRMNLVIHNPIADCNKIVIDGKQQYNKGVNKSEDGREYNFSFNFYGKPIKILLQ